MWCIGKITEEYRERMYDLLELYARPYNPDEPVICMDEKSKQLIAHSRPPLPPAQDGVRKEDYEYKRHGTRNIFVAVEPKAGQRMIAATARRTKQDFAKFIEALTDAYPNAATIHLVLDNLNTHFETSLFETFSKENANAIADKITWHHTPKHASWLNMAEIEIGIFDRECLDRRLPDEERLKTEIAAWEKRRNTERRKIHWTFTKQDADRKLGKHYI